MVLTQQPPMTMVMEVPVATVVLVVRVVPEAMVVLAA
jgi:hypothetical protein